MDRQPTVALRHASQGFTLFELAVVLLVVTLLLGSILVPLRAQVQQRNIAETQRILEETRDSLIGYAMIHGRLPRPAASATDGVERDTPCTRDADCTGFVPWATLGTSQVDAWGKILRYSRVANLPTNHTVDGMLMASHEMRKRFLIAIKNTAND